MKPTIVAVTGATGWIGGEVCRALQARGCQPRPLARGLQCGGHFDLAEPQWGTAWRPALAGCDAVIHCAAFVHRPAVRAEEIEECMRTNAEGVRRLAHACREFGVSRLVLASTIAVYGSARDGRESRWTENDPLEGRTPYARSKIEGEAAVRAAGGDWRIVRLATVYGWGDRANFARLAAALRRRRFVIPGWGEARKSVVALPDAGEILAMTALRDDLGQTVINLAASHAPSLAEICEVFGRYCGFPPPPRCPRPLLRAVARAGDVLKSVTGRSPLTTETLAKLTESTVVDTALLQSLFPLHRWNSFGESLRASAPYYAGL